MSDNNLEKVLIIDDNSDYRKLIKTFIKKLLPGVETIEYDPVFEGIPDDNFNWSEIDVLLLDYHLSIVGTTGLDILHKNHKKPTFPATIMLTGAGTEEIAIRALKTGIFEYLPKQSLTKDKLKQSIIHAWEEKKSERKNKQNITQHNKSFSKEVFYENLTRSYERKNLDRALVIIKPDDLDLLEEQIGIIGRDNLVNHIAKNSFEVFNLGACKPNITRISDTEIGVQIDYPVNDETLDFNMRGLLTHLSKCTFKFSEEKYTFSVSIGILRLGLFNEPAERLIQIASAACNVANKIIGNSHYIWKETDELPGIASDATTTVTPKENDKSNLQSEQLESDLKAAENAKQEAEAAIRAEQDAKEKLTLELKQAAEANEKAEMQLQLAAEAKKIAEQEAEKIREEERLRTEKLAKEIAEKGAEEKEKIALELKLEAEAKAKAEADLVAITEEKLRAEARLKAETEEKAKAEAVLKADQEELERKEAEFRKTIAEEKAKAEAELNALAEEKLKAEAKLKAESEEKAKAEAELKADQEELERKEAEFRKAIAEEKAKAEAELNALTEEKLKAEEKLKKEAEEKAKAEAELKAIAEEKAKAEAELKAIAEEKAKAEAELRANQERKEQIEAETEVKVAQEEREKAEAELKAIAEEKAKVEAQMRAEQEAQQRIEAELKIEKEAEAKAKAEAEMKAAKEEKEKLQAELKAVAEAKEKAEAEMKAAKEEKERLQAELKAAAETKENKVADATTNTEKTEQVVEAKKEQPVKSDKKIEETTNNESSDTADSDETDSKNNEFEEQVTKLINEKRIIQTYQPITAMFEGENETKEIYKTGLSAISESDEFKEYLSNTAAFPISLQQTINEWILRQVFLRITESGTDKCQYQFLVKVTESWFSDITLFQWLQKILSQTKKYNPGKSIILDVPIDIYEKHKKRAEALINTLRKSHQFTIALSNVEDTNTILNYCTMTSSSLLLVNIEQLKKLTEKLAPETEDVEAEESDEESEKQNLLQYLKSKNIRLITSGIEDSTLLMDAITAGTDYTVGGFVGEIQENLVETSTVESFELT